MIVEQMFKTEYLENNVYIFKHSLTFESLLTFLLIHLN
jgi:hypothetical protein